MNKPNIIYIYCDELRTDALGCYEQGTIKMKTPHIDSLARNGVCFTNCFCTSPVCVSSRTSQLTGLYPEDTGVYHNEGAWPSFSLDNPPITFPEVFAAHGYQTANFGKTHIPKPLNPWIYSENPDLTYFEFLQLLATEDFSESNLIYDRDRPWIIFGGTYPDKIPNHSSLLVRTASNWVEQTKEPFLIRLSFSQPHTPILVPKPFDEVYTPSDFDEEVDFSPESSTFERLIGEFCNTDHLSIKDHQRIKAYYYGFVTWLDAQVGLLINYIKNRVDIENTIVVLEADHGVSLGEGKRYHKLSFAPEVHRVPRIIQYPARLPGGIVSEEITDSMDLARTLFSLAEIEAPEQFKGRDLFSEPGPKAIFSTIGYGSADSYMAPFAYLGRYTGGRGWPRRACIRTGQYRLDKNVLIDDKPASSDDEDVFLVDYRSDPKEIHNLASRSEYEQVMKELSFQINGHIQDSVEPQKKYLEHPSMVASEISALREQLLKKFESY